MGILKASEWSETWNMSMGIFFTNLGWEFFRSAPSFTRYQQFGNLPRDDGRNFAHESQKRNPSIKFVENNPKTQFYKI